MSLIKLDDLALAGKRVLIRADLNVPIKDGKVVSDVRIRATLPSIERLLQGGAKVIVASHLGRPQEGEYQEEYSLAPVVDHLRSLLKVPVRLVRDYLSGVEVLQGELVVLENVRFNSGEKKNSQELAQQYAALCDIFVMDAFGTAHRAEASTQGVAEFAPLACAGPLLCSELAALNQILANPKPPLVAVIGGAKVSSKLPLLNSLIEKVDQLIVGGGICNTFLVAQGHVVGRSLYEAELVEQARQLLQTGKILLPVDVRVATRFSEQAVAELKEVGDVGADDYILDFGDSSEVQMAALLKGANSIIWNGPVGVFEFPNFARGTEAIAAAIASSAAFSVAGGGDTLAAIERFGVADKISYISTGGGAFLEFLEGRTLPAVEVLQRRAAR